MFNDDNYNSDESDFQGSFDGFDIPLNEPLKSQDNLNIKRNALKKLKESPRKSYLYVVFKGRPLRDTPICNDDILNLIITLNTTSDVNELLAVA